MYIYNLISRYAYSIYLYISFAKLIFHLLHITDFCKNKPRFYRM